MRPTEETAAGSQGLREAAQAMAASRARVGNDDGFGAAAFEVAEPPAYAYGLGAHDTSARGCRHAASCASDLNLSHYSPRSAIGAGGAPTPGPAGDLSAYSSGSEGDGAFLGPSALDYYSGTDDLVRRQKDRVISIILGNLFTLGIVGLVYFNYVLFESYIGVFLYAFLASEALWDTKKGIVDCLVFINDEDTVSPRRMLEYGLRTAHAAAKKRGWVLALLGAVFGAIFLLDPLLSVFILLAIGAMGLVIFALDRRVFFLTKMHRFALNDSTFVALLLILVLLVLGVVCTTLFAVFAFHDVKVMLQMIHTWAEETLMNSTWAQDVWKEVAGQGDDALDSWLGDFEHQYVTNTTWEPAFRWVVRYMEESRLANGNETLVQNQTCVFEAGGMPLSRQAAAACSVSAAETGIFGAFGAASSSAGAASASVTDGNFLMADSWFAIPDWMQNRSIQEILQVVAEHTKTTDLSGITDKVHNVAVSARDGFWTSTIFTMSVLFLVIDFGVRVMFFLTILFILLSSEDNLMHEILTGIFSSDAADIAASENASSALGAAADFGAGSGHAPIAAMSGASPHRGPNAPPSSELRRSAFIQRIKELASSASEPSAPEADAGDSGTAAEAAVDADTDAEAEADADAVDADSDFGALSPRAGPLGAAALAGSVPEERVSDIILLEQQLRATMEAVLMLTVKMSFYRATATLVLFKVMGIQLPYLAALFTIALTLFPIVYAYWACLPWCLIFALNGHYHLSLLLFLLQYLISAQLDSWALGTFQKKVQQPSARQHTDQSKNEFMTGMSMFFGVTAFGAHGVILGPLLVCLGIVSYNTLKNTQQSVRSLQGGVGQGAPNSSLALSTSLGLGAVGPAASVPGTASGIQRTWSTETPASRQPRRRRARAHRRSDSESHRPHQLGLGLQHSPRKTRSQDVPVEETLQPHADGERSALQQHGETAIGDHDLHFDPPGSSAARSGGSSPRGSGHGRRQSDPEGSSLSTSSSTSSFCAVKSFDEEKRVRDHRGEDAAAASACGARNDVEGLDAAEDEEPGHQRRSSEPAVGLPLDNDSDDATADPPALARAGSSRGRTWNHERARSRGAGGRATDSEELHGRRSRGGDGVLARQHPRLAHTASFTRPGSSGRTGSLRRHHTSSPAGETPGFFEKVLNTAIHATTGTRSRPPSGGTLSDILARGEGPGAKTSGTGGGALGAKGSGSMHRRTPEEKLKQAKSFLKKGYISEEHYDDFVKTVLAGLRDL